MIHSSRTIVFAVERYYNIHRIMLTILGLWPYQKPSILRLQTIFFFGVYFCLIFSESMTFVTTTYTKKFIVKQISYIFLASVYFFNYNSFYFNIEAVKRMMEHITLDWKRLKINEIKILEKYTRIGHCVIVILFILGGISMIMFVFFDFAPIILDAIIPLNESRPRNTQVSFELFIDEQQYFFVYVTHEVITVTIGVWSTITTGLFLVAFGLHCCATFQIASKLLQNTVTDYTLQIPAPQKMYFMYQNLCRAVHIHRRTKEFLNEILAAFHIWFLPLIVVGVLSLSCMLFRLCNAVKQLNDLYELLTCIMLFGGHLVYMFGANFLGQMLIDHNRKMLNATYDTLWYVAPLPIQKLLLFIQKSLKDQHLLIAGMYVASLEGFATLITSSISYFTVMYTMQ